MLVTTGATGIFAAVCAKATCANSSKAPSCIALIIPLPFFRLRVTAESSVFQPLNQSSRCEFAGLPLGAILTNTLWRVLMTLITIHAVVYIRAAETRMTEIGRVPASMALGALEDR